MKKYIHKKAIIAAVTILGIIGCTEFVDKIDDFKIGIASTIFDQNAVIQLTDINGNQSDINSTDFTVDFTGADADKLVSEAGELTINATQGYIQLNVNPNKSSGVKELNFNVTVSGGTYRTATFPITLKDSTSFIQVQMVNEAKMVGTDKASNTANLTNNATTAAVTVTTTANKSTNTSTVTVNSGTQFKDAAGAVITGGDVKVAVDNVDIVGEDSDPKYDEQKVFKDANGNEITGERPILLGRTVINMEVGGKQVKQFDKPIDVAISIPNTIKNPATGNTVQLGDTFPIYTNEEGSEDWTYHGLGTVVAGATSDTFNVTFNTTHLSTYTIKYDQFSTCAINPEYKFKELSIPTDYAGEFDLVLTTKRTYPGYPFLSPSISSYKIFHISIANSKVTATKPVGTTLGEIISRSIDNYYYKFKNVINTGKETLVEDVWGDGKLIKETSLSLQKNGEIVKANLSDIVTTSDCSALIDLTTLAVNNSNLKDINIDVAANCNGNTLVPDGFPIYVERPDGSFSYEGTIKNGKLKLFGFELNKEYNFKSFYKGKTYTHKWTFTTTSYVDKNFSIPDNLCSEIGF